MAKHSSRKHRDGGNILDVGPLDIRTATLRGLVVNSYTVSAAQSARRIVVNSGPSPRSRQSRSPGSTFPHGLPREAGGHQKRLLGSTGIFLLLGPLASTWAVSVSLTGTCLGGPVHPPKGSL